MLSGCVVGWIKSNGLMCVGKVEREKKSRGTHLAHFP